MIKVSVRWKFGQTQEIYRWCEEQFRPRSESHNRWKMGYLSNGQFWEFQREQDAVLFSLRWK